MPIVRIHTDNNKKILEIERDYRILSRMTNITCAVHAIFITCIIHTINLLLVFLMYPHDYSALIYLGVNGINDVTAEYAAVHFTYKICNKILAKEYSYLYSFLRGFLYYMFWFSFGSYTALLCITAVYNDETDQSRRITYSMIPIMARMFIMMASIKLIIDKYNILYSENLNEKYENNTIELVIQDDV